MNPMSDFFIAKEGLPIVFGFLLIAIALKLLLPSWGGIAGATVFGILTVFSLWFFRNPERLPPPDASAIISPADGTVIEISEVDETRYLKEKVRKISIFMSVFNVHVNRFPVSGKVTSVDYVAGKYLVASLPKASLDNEHNSVIVETTNGIKVMFVQIAGFVARRIVCYARPGDTAVKGARMGMIKFGSRLDVYVPLNCTIGVKLGDRPRAGETILAKGC